MIDFEWLDMNYSHDNLEANEINAYETGRVQKCHKTADGHEVCAWVDVQEGGSIKNTRVTGGGVGGRIRF